MIPKIYCILFSLFFSLCTPAHATRAFVFDIHIEQTAIADGGKNRAQKRGIRNPGTTRFTVFLGQHFFTRQQGATRVVYDFKQKRIFTVNDRKKQYEDDSLYADLGFRLSELKNREFLGVSMEKARIRENPIPVAYSEHLFSVQVKDSGTRIQEAGGKETVSYSWNGKILATVSRDGRAADQEMTDRFVRFVRYSFGVHPQILQKISSLRRIPQRMTIYRYSLGTETTRLTLVSDSPAADTYSLAGFQEGLLPSNQDRVSRMIMTVKKSPPGDYDRRGRETAAAALRSFRQKQPFVSMLTYLEYSLQSGNPMPESFERSREDLYLNNDVQKLFAVLTPKGREEAEKALTVYKDLRDKAGNKSYILMFFEAIARTLLNQDDEAERLFLRILSHNAYLSAVYKELGDLYFKRYEMQKAWRCWDAGRRLTPASKKFQPASDLELLLEREHPEFF